MAAGDRVTIHEVAKRANVSISTVSRALSGARRVDPELAARVTEVATQLGYRPNKIAKALRKNITQTVGFVVPDITNPFFPSLIQALEIELREQGVALLLGNAENDPRIEALAVNSLLDRNVDALFISPSHREHSAGTLHAIPSHVRAVQVDRFAVTELPYIGVDQHAAMGDLVAHLTARGHRELGFVGANRQEWPAFRREAAYREIVTGPSATRVLTATASISAGREIGRTLPARWPGVHGIICANDLLAYGCIEALRVHHSEVAAAYAITGFDNTILAEAGSFTSVEQPVRAVAAQAVKQMLRDEPAAAAPTFTELAAHLVSHP